MDDQAADESEQNAMSDPVIKKLECLGSLPEEDKRLLRAIVAQEREVSAQTDLVREGDDPTTVHLLTDGFACRYKRFADGKRQIVAFLVPGDFDDPYTFMLKSIDHGISTMTTSKVVRVSKLSMLEMLSRPSLAHAMYVAALTDLAILRVWIANIGQRGADCRIAHLSANSMRGFKRSVWRQRG